MKLMKNDAFLTAAHTADARPENSSGADSSLSQAPKIPKAVGDVRHSWCAGGLSREGAPPRPQCALLLMEAVPRQGAGARPVHPIRVIECQHTISSEGSALLFSV